MIKEFFTDIILGTLSMVLEDWTSKKHTPLLERFRRRRWRDEPKDEVQAPDEENKPRR